MTEGKQPSGFRPPATLVVQDCQGAQHTHNLSKFSVDKTGKLWISDGYDGPVRFIYNNDGWDWIEIREVVQ